MRYKHTIFGALILGFIIWAGVPISAQTSQPYDRVGTLDEKNLDQKIVVIYDELYNLNSGVKVYHFNSEVDNTNPEEREQASLETLTPGMTLGYTVTSGQITEIWIIPSESVATMNAEAEEN